MLNLEELEFTNEQIEFIKEIMEKGRINTQNALFKRYGVSDIEELDNLFDKAKFYNAINEKETALLLATDLNELDDLIGQDKVKSNIKRILRLINKQRFDNERTCNVLCFSGEHGIGKNTIAKLFTKILFNKDLIINQEPEIINGSNFGRSDIRDIYDSNERKVVIIKNACDMFYTSQGFRGYSLYDLYEAIDKNTNVITIFCDTKQRFQSNLDENKQFFGRASHVIEFEPYSIDELYEILTLFLKRKLYSIGGNASEEIKKIIKYQKRQAEYLNIRSIHVLMEKLLIIQASRTMNPYDRVITLKDVYEYESQEKITRNMVDDNSKEYEKKLNELIGLDNVKKQIKGLKAYALKNKDSSTNLNLHMCFTGNPGTGKTIVAKLLAGILYENGILPENKLIERDRSNLIGRFVGQTAPLVREAVSESLGGVLFIDEAYSLYSSGVDGDYGIEAISELIKCMEEYRGQFALIFAGYKDETLKMIQSNPGLKSRINRYIDFPNYSHDELLQIAGQMTKKDGYICANSLLNKVCNIVEEKKTAFNYGNARDVRNVLESVYEIQALRTIDDLSNREILIDDIDSYISISNTKFKNKDLCPIDETKESLCKLYSRCMKVASINTEYIDERTVYIKRIQDNKFNGSGTGFLISDSGLIVTNNHVVEDGDEIKVRLSLYLKDGRKTYKECDALICKTSKEHDIAILKIDEKGTYPFFSLAKDNLVELTQVIMGGYPFGATLLSEISFSEGLVQSVNELSAFNDDESVKYIYVDITGVPGCSGSALINKKTGEVIGVYSGSISIEKEGLRHEMKYAMPTEYIWQLLPSKKQTKPRKAVKLTA